MTLFDYIFDFLFNPWFLISLIFWLIVLFFVFLLRNKKGAYSIFFPLLALFKTKKLNNLIKKISRKRPKSWRIFWTIGIFVSFGFTIYGFYFFFTNVISLIFTPSIENVIIPLIPGVNIDLPFLFYLILPLLFIMTTHEFAHGISASNDGVDIKSTGVLGAGLFFIIGFGAFVEVDERELRSTKYHRNTRLRISSAGTWVNAITAGIAFILLISYPLLISPFYVQVTHVYNVLPPEEGGFNYGVLNEGDAIVAIKRQGEANDQYIQLDEYQGINLGAVLDNQTRIKCSVGDNLTFYTYNSRTNIENEKDVLLGPRYNLSIEYEYLSNTELRITYNYSSKQNPNLIITKINSTDINRTNGDTLEKLLTNFTLKTINLTSNIGIDYLIDVELVGVFVGVQSTLFWMHKNDFAKFFTANWPEFWLRELLWLFVISFSITLFNTTAIPIFDGDRNVKELINWIFGENYQSKKKKKDKFLYKEENTDCALSELRVESIDSIKILLKGNSNEEGASNIILGESNYKLIDKIGDGFKDTVSIKLPDNTNINENTLFEISYNYWYDNKKKIKNVILYSIRAITLIIIALNFILSFVKFGFDIFWI
ncbi:MAG: site-2 protease family protein [Candidatus Hodarchaeota archaeon]